MRKAEAKRNMSRESRHLRTNELSDHYTGNMKKERTNGTPGKEKNGEVTIERKGRAAGKETNGKPNHIDIATVRCENEGHAKQT